ncbi:MAG: BRO family protein [Candidatus Hydrogenedentales bacterium]|jgi:DNA-damage-inducible protein D
MSKHIQKSGGDHISPFEKIKRTNDNGMEYWSSRDFAAVLDYGDYRNFERVIEKAKRACFNSGNRIEDHFVDVTDMVEIGSGGRRAASESCVLNSAFILLETGIEGRIRRL